MMEEKGKTGGREMVVYEGKQRAVVEEEKQGKEYPAPLFTHKELCSEPGIFVEALRRFHSLMGTKFMIPVMGGKDLNLHLLYVEVTQRGGLERVIMEKRWREVIAIFNFPPTTTSASFVLRKYYLSLLHHFEQVYFFGARGALVPPAETLQTRTQMCKFDDMVRSDPGPAMGRKRAFQPEILPGGNFVPEYSKEHQVYRSSCMESPSPNYGRKRPIVVQSIHQIPNGHLSAEPCSLHLEGSLQHTPRSAPPTDGSDRFGPSASIPPADGTPSATGGTRNFTVTGTIDGKFDYGYFVSVKIGSQLLHGVLYHIHHHHQIGSPPSLLSSPPLNNPLFHIPPPSPSSFSGRRRRLKNRDPARPKPNRSAYNFFFAEKHFELKAQRPHIEREYSKRIGESWNKLTGEDRRRYEDHARRDKERYRKEMQMYKERFKFLEIKQPQDFSERIERDHSKEISKLEKQQVRRREMPDYVEGGSNVAITAEIGSSEKGEFCLEK